MPARQYSLVAAILFLVCPFVLFWQVWWPDAGKRLVFAYGDFVEQCYPMRVFVAHEYHNGRLPLWDPYTYSGEPAAATGQFAPFYLVGMWRLVFGEQLPFWALEVECIFHLSLAGLFTFLLVRRLTGRATAGLIAGVAFGLGGFLTSYPVLQMVILETAVWLPAGLWLLERALARGSVRSVIPVGLVMGLSLLAGHPQTFLYMAYLSGAFLLVRARFHGWTWRRILAAALLLAGITAGFASVQWLPALELARLSPRAQLTYQEVSQGFELKELWGLIRPNPGQWSPLYVGLIPLGLALIGLFAWRRETRLWALVAAIALLLSLGDKGYLYRLAYRVAPGFSVFRHQERAAFLVSFALSILAGYGFAALARRRWWPGWAVLPLLLLAFLDLFRANNGIILQTPPPGGYFASTPTLELIRSVDNGIRRASSEALLPGDGNAGLAFQFRDVTGNNPLRLAAYDRFTSVIPELRWWQMLNVQHLLTRRQLDHGALSLLLDGDEMRLYRVSLGGRPVWVVHAYQLASSQEEAIQWTADPTLDPFQTGVLEQSPEPLPQPADEPDQVHVIAYEAQRIAVEAMLDAPAILVLSEVSYPGWTVRVNGVRVSALRAFGLLRAVALPAGQSRVEWRFEPLTVRLGLTVSLVTLLGSGVVTCVRRKR